MTKLRICILRAAVPFMAVAAISAGLDAAQGAQCKRKTAGFYLEDASVNGARSLAQSLQNLPASLTGTPGDPDRGREVLVSRQKGDCLSCHRLGVLATVAAQGSIGPALDGVGKKYSDAQLRLLLIEPKAYFPEAMMPAYYRGAESSVLTAAEAEDLVAFLSTLK